MICWYIITCVLAAWDGGAIDFRGGQWAGIELDEATGKNDGSLKGIRFFTCKPKFGEFVTGWGVHGVGNQGSKFKLRSVVHKHLGEKKQGGKLYN